MTDRQMNQPAPVDLAVLAEQTGGDTTLEREVLALFAADAPRLAGIVRSPVVVDRRAAAHRLAGSARAVGAGEVARQAAAIEAGRGDVAALDAAIAEARRFIAAHLDRTDPAGKPG